MICVLEIVAASIYWTCYYYVIYRRQAGRQAMIGLHMVSVLLYIHTICRSSRLFSHDIGAWTRDGMIAMRPHFGHLVILLIFGNSWPSPSDPQAECPTPTLLTKFDEHFRTPAKPLVELHSELRNVSLWHYIEGLTWW